LLDPAVVQLAASLPARFKLRGTKDKWLLRQLAGKLLPQSIVQRKKKGFGVPLAAWLRGPLSGWMQDQLAPNRIARSGLLDQAVVQRVMQDHLQRRADHRKTLWALLSLMAFEDRLAAEPAAQPRE
jgi:asparagine synthase (glutamine-hydrolysing)